MIATNRNIIMKKIGKGRTAEVYNYKNNKVLKLFYSSSNDKDIECEYLITKKISDITHLAPQVYNVVNIKNRVGIVYEKMKGETLSDYLSKNFRNDMVLHFHQ